MWRMDIFSRASVLGIKVKDFLFFVSAFRPVPTRAAIFIECGSFRKQMDRSISYSYRSIPRWCLRFKSVQTFIMHLAPKNIYPGCDISIYTPWGSWFDVRSINVSGGDKVRNDTSYDGTWEEMIWNNEIISKRVPKNYLNTVSEKIMPSIISWGT